MRQAHPDLTGHADFAGQGHGGLAQTRNAQGQIDGFTEPGRAGEIAVDVYGWHAKVALLMQGLEIAAERLGKPVFDVIVEQHEILRIENDAGRVAVRKANLVGANEFHHRSVRTFHNSGNRTTSSILRR